MKWHQELPPGVHPYPTLKGKKRFEMLQVFNVMLGSYILIHKLIVPLVVFLLQTGGTLESPQVGYWYLYHFFLAFLLAKRFRTPRRAYWIVYLAWFAIGYLPLTLVESLLDQGAIRLQWKAISGILCYGSSLVLTLFLLYRMRMPTTAYLFKLEQRIIPRWRYALPYAFVGCILSAVRFFH